MAGNTPVVGIPFPLAEEIARAERSVEQSIGAYLLGTFFSLPLYGVGLYQLYRYCRLYSKDATYIRIIVATVMVLGTIQAVMAMHGRSTSFLPVVSNVIITVSQLFFARRVFLLGSFYKIIAALALIFLLAQTALGLALTVLLFRMKVFSINSALPYAWTYPSFFGCATFADLLLSGSIIRAMRRSRAAHVRKETYFDIFLLYVVNTGASKVFEFQYAHPQRTLVGFLTGLFNTIPFVWSLARPKDLEWIAFNSIVCKLYANTLLAVLNSRKFFVCRGMEILDGKSFGQGIIARVDHLAAAERWNVPQLPDPRSAPIKVGIQMETETDGPRVGLGDGSKALEAKTGVYEKSAGSAVLDVQSTTSL
ncbi:hypothetical protein TRAPUB_8351 [Trametes pubescens]|uniref:DUF6534 domain-containing protein n=1 Tax=Trametes pubescens TaxID=154538 RepID=A0A1M2W5E9_TRAPU|nr:hypothetical protein TRAPUB_8351 [Trametes pubescens]